MNANAPTPPGDFALRAANLTTDLVEQGRRVQRQIEACFEALFERNPQKAAAAKALDDEIDRIDVAMEQAAVQLLTDATRAGACLEPAELRWVLTIVKVNNELERIADAGVDVCNLIEPGLPNDAPFPPTFRIMANSVIGILRDVGSGLSRKDAVLCKVVLQSQHAVSRFKSEIVRDAERKVAEGSITVDFAFRLHEIAGLCELIADHCTNIAEQVIYATTGAIVRHTQSAWVEVPRSNIA